MYVCIYILIHILAITEPVDQPAEKLNVCLVWQIGVAIHTFLIKVSKILSSSYVNNTF